MRILQGMTEVAGQAYYSAKGLKMLELDVKKVVWRKHLFAYPEDYCLNIGYNKLLYPWYAFKMICFALYAVVRFDTYHFHYGYSLLPYLLDLLLLKSLRKKVVFEFHGSDLRYKLKYQVEEAPAMSPAQKRNIEKICKYADAIIIHDEELRPHLPNICAPVYLVPLRIDLQKFKPHYPDAKKDKPVIVHAPSKRSGKGSKYIIEAVEKVQGKYPLEFILVENKTQEEAFSIYEKADIIIDQMFAGTYGVFAIEAMALGKPVISYIASDMANEFPKELPIVSADITNLEEKIQELVLDSVKRNELGVLGRKYVSNYHDYKKIAKLLYNIYSGTQVPNGHLEAFEEVRKQ